MKELTDEHLMSEVLAGNLDTLKVLFERHHEHVFNFLYKMSNNRAVSEDITQEVFYKLIKYRASFNNEKFVPWLFAIVRNSLNEHYRRAKPYVNLDSVKYKLTIPQNEESEDYSDLYRALNRLNVSDRELLILNKLQKIKYKELAEILGSTPGAIKTKVSRALKKLKVVYIEN